MEKKPIKRNEHIVRLSKDHHLSLLFCWKIRNGLKYEAAPGRIKEYVRYFWQEHMEPHFREEEEILFTPVQDEAVRRALQEHAAIRRQIEALELGDQRADTLLTALADMVDNHVRYEERELFPHLEQILTPEQLQHIGARLQAEHPTALKDDFADEFWLPKKS